MTRPTAFPMTPQRLRAAPLTVAVVLAMPLACTEAPGPTSPDAELEPPSASASPTNGAMVVKEEFSFPVDVVDPAACLDEDVRFTGFMNGRITTTFLPDGSVQFNWFREGRSLVAEGVETGRLWESRAAVTKINARGEFTEECDAFSGFGPAEGLCASQLTFNSRFVYMAVDHDGPNMTIEEFAIFVFDDEGNLLNSRMEFEFLECLGSSGGRT